MKCIGRECIYNRCDCGNYCGLAPASFTKENSFCVIDEEIEDAFETLNRVKVHYERLLAEKENIIIRQK